MVVHNDGQGSPYSTNARHASQYSMASLGPNANDRNRAASPPMNSTG